LPIARKNLRPPLPAIAANRCGRLGWDRGYAYAWRRRRTTASAYAVSMPRRLQWLRANGQALKFIRRKAGDTDW